MSATVAAENPGLLDWLADGGGRELVESMEQRRPGVLAALGVGGIAPLAAAVEVDALVSALPYPAEGWISLVRGHASSLPRGFQTSEGLVNLGEVTRAYADGATLLLTKLQRRVPAVGRLCRALEEILLAAGLVPAQRVGANLYLTPRGAQGFDLHYDDHEVLVVQLEGVKHWEVYSESIPFPVSPPSRPLDSQAVGAPVVCCSLGPGDALYVPSGFPHKARADADIGSCHLTLSLHLATWIDLLRRVLADSAAARRPLRLGVPAGEASDAGLEPVLDVCRDPARLASGLATLRDRFVEGLDLLPDGVLGARHPHDGLDDDSEVVVRRGIVGRLARDGDGAVVLTVPGAAIRCSADVQPALEHLLAQRRSRVGELPSLGPADRLHLVRALVSYGVLHRVERG